MATAEAAPPRRESVRFTGPGITSPPAESAPSAHCLPMPVDKYPIHQLTHLGTMTTSYCEPDRFVHRTYAIPHARHSRPIYKLCWRRRRCACQEQHRDEHGPRSSARSLGGEGAIIVELQTNEPDVLDPQGAHEKDRSIASKGAVPNTQQVWNDALTMP